jgi:lysophospholipase L1-like esterase
VNKRWVIVALFVAAIGGGGFVSLRDDGAPPDPAPPPAVPLPLPNSIAAIGDSITAGVGASPQGFDTSPQHSWATGDADDDVISHHERLLAAGAPVDGQNYNFAESGATMADAPDQARRVVATGSSYVVILMGGNDVCASSLDTMTPVASFKRDFRTTLDILTRGLPQARFFVVSIPNVHRLWETFHNDPIPPRVWEAAGTCGAMLDAGNTDAERGRALQRNMDYNQALEEVCATEPRCRFDNHALFHYEFDADLVAVDYFHPSHQGHEVIAELTWDYGYWPDL